MSRHYVIRCDAKCGSEVMTDDPRRGNWYVVDRFDPREFNEVGNSDQFDFCSLPCLASWAHSREIVRAAS